MICINSRKLSLIILFFSVFAVVAMPKIHKTYLDTRPNGSCGELNFCRQQQQQQQTKHNVQSVILLPYYFWLQMTVYLIRCWQTLLFIITDQIAYHRKDQKKKK